MQFCPQTRILSTLPMLGHQKSSRSCERATHFSISLPLFFTLWQKKKSRNNIRKAEKLNKKYNTATAAAATTITQTATATATRNRKAEIIALALVQSNQARNHQANRTNRPSAKRRRRRQRRRRDGDGRSKTKLPTTVGLRWSRLWRR